jgi:hypothetical protein
LKSKDPPKPYFCFAQLQRLIVLDETTELQIQGEQLSVSSFILPIVSTTTSFTITCNWHLQMESKTLVDCRQLKMVCLHGIKPNRFHYQIDDGLSVVFTANKSQLERFIAKVSKRWQTLVMVDPNVDLDMSPSVDQHVKLWNSPMGHHDNYFTPSVASDDSVSTLFGVPGMDAVLDDAFYNFRLDEDNIDEKHSPLAKTQMDPEATATWFERPTLNSNYNAIPYDTHIDMMTN